jgi:hypothetical protein
MDSPEGREISSEPHIGVNAMPRKVSLKDKEVKNAKKVKGGPIYMMPTDQKNLTDGSLNFVKIDFIKPDAGALNFHKH